jgi:hypothetical protein
LPINQSNHQAFLRFIRRAADLTADYSMDELWNFRNLARIETPLFVRLIDAYVELAEKSETSSGNFSLKRRKRNGSQTHLFDLLREKTFFPLNLDLAQFAARVLPNMRTFRFDKMSRSDIAARIIEYLESQSNVGAKDRLETSMREALTEMKHRPAKPAERKSFLSKWEKIIKGIEL